MVPAYLAALIVLALGDLVWLGIVMRDFYRANVGHLMGDSVNWTPAVLFYFLYTAAILFFVVYPTTGKPLTTTLGVGALFGLSVYAVYNLTNMAALRGWPATLGTLDIVWGALLTAAVSGVAALALRYFGN